MTEKKSSSTPKRVVYLLGAGATQAEVSLKDETIRILMLDIKEGILKRIDADSIKELNVVKNELTNEFTDVEQLITLYESTGIPEHEIIAKKLKELFWKEIQERIKKLGEKYEPKLLAALIDMHEIPGLQSQEELIGIITLNYEDLLEKAIQRIKARIDYSIKLTNDHSYLRFGNPSKPTPIVLKLHGSFNWKNEHPVKLMDEFKIKNAEDVLWIPPGVEKKRERYPFNILWGRAREILDCDILRVIGCSLSRNDWQLISLLYTTQHLATHKKEYVIELIDYAKACKEISNNYPYLRFRHISEIKEVREFLAKSFSEDYGEDKISIALEELLNNSKTNIFDTWLRARGENLKKHMTIETKSMIFENYFYEVA